MTTAIVKPVDEVKGHLVRMQDQFKEALPKHIQPEKFIRVAQTAIIAQPSLLSLDRTSLYQAFVEAAQSGLLPDKKEAAIVPFKGKAKLMPMVAGICKKVRNSGEISTIDALVVYEKDEYQSFIDEKGPHFKHIRAYGDRGKPILTYAYAIGKDGGVFFEEIDEEQMAKIEKCSKASDSPWKGPFRDEMKRKSAIRRLAKYRLPNSSDLDILFKKDDEYYDDTEPVPAEEATDPTRLGKVIEAEAEVVDKPVPAPEVKTTPKPEPVAKAKPVAKSQPAGLIVAGMMRDFKVKEGKFQSGKEWRRYALRLVGRGDKEYWGTFDDEMGKQIEVALDSGNEIKVTYKERRENGNKYRDIISLEFDPKDDFEEGIPVESVPI